MDNGNYPAENLTFSSMHNVQKILYHSVMSNREDKEITENTYFQKKILDSIIDYTDIWYNLLHTGACPLFRVIQGYHDLLQYHDFASFKFTGKPF